jgi:hypothetical protein
VSAPAISVACFDRDREVHAIVREGIALVFDGQRPLALPDAPELGGDERSGFRARAGERLALELEPLGEPADLGGQRTWLCRARGTLEGRHVDGLGTATETVVAPAWEELDALRGITALFDERHAIVCVARRPRSALAHAEEDVRASLLVEGELVDVEEVRLSTVYDGEGRQRSAGFELWLPGEDFPRRAFGTVEAGTTLQLEQLRVNAAVFSWRMEGRQGAGAYDLVVREPAPAAA